MLKLVNYHNCSLGFSNFVHFGGPVSVKSPLVWLLIEREDRGGPNFWIYGLSALNESLICSDLSDSGSNNSGLGVVAGSVGGS